MRAVPGAGPLPASRPCGRVRQEPQEVAGASHARPPPSPGPVAYPPCAGRVAQEPVSNAESTCAGRTPCCRAPVSVHPARRALARARHHSERIPARPLVPGGDAPAPGHPPTTGGGPTGRLDPLEMASDQPRHLRPAVPARSSLRRGPAPASGHGTADPPSRGGRVHPSPRRPRRTSPARTARSRARPRRAGARASAAWAQGRTQTPSEPRQAGRGPDGVGLRRAEAATASGQTQVPTTRHGLQYFSVPGALVCTHQFAA